MAHINGYYIHVTSEDLDGEVELSTHPVESGIDITDTVKKQPEKVSLSGKVVDYFNGSEIVKAATVKNKIQALRDTGAIVVYSGRNFLENYQIKNFNTSHPNTVTGGMEFNMELQQCRIAKNSYEAPVIKDSNIKDGGTQQVEKGENKKVYYTVKKGDTIWGLLTGTYKNLIYLDDGKPVNYNINEKCDWVMHFNPHAFSRKGDFRTLQIGKKILLGFRG